MDCDKYFSILLFCLINLFSEAGLTILEPFYAQEAIGRGLTVTQAGQVIGTVFIVNIILLPLVTRLIPVVGARSLLLAGTLLVCALHLGTTATIGSSKKCH